MYQAATSGVPDATGLRCLLGGGEEGFPANGVFQGGEEEVDDFLEEVELLQYPTLNNAKRYHSNQGELAQVPYFGLSGVQLPRCLGRLTLTTIAEHSPQEVIVYRTLRVQM